MGYIIEITEDKVESLMEHAKKILKHGRELYKCMEELSDDSNMGERMNYPHEGNYVRGGRYANRTGRIGYRDEDYEEDDDDFMGERRGRSSTTGRYMRR